MDAAVQTDERPGDYKSGPSFRGFGRKKNTLDRWRTAGSKRVSGDSGAAFRATRGTHPTTYKLAKMNLAIRGIDAKIELGDTFHNDRHKDLKADYIIANPPCAFKNFSLWTNIPPLPQQPS